MQKWIGSAILLGVLCASSTALAQRYGTAGCGLGSIAFGNQPGMIQVLAATTNGTFFTQTFGISTGTSNCQSTGAGAQSTRVFVAVNREALSKDIARGQGETIVSLSALAGCRDATAVGATLQRNFKTIFPSASVSTDDVSQSVLSTLKSDKVLACGSI